MKFHSPQFLFSLHQIGSVIFRQIYIKLIRMFLDNQNHYSNEFDGHISTTAWWIDMKRHPWCVQKCSFSFEYYKLQQYIIHACWSESACKSESQCWDLLWPHSTQSFLCFMWRLAQWQRTVLATYKPILVYDTQALQHNISATNMENLDKLLQ